MRALNELRRIEGKGEGRIVYAFHKVVIPDDKLIEVEIYEKGGGRTSGSISRTVTWWTPDWWTN